MSIHCGLATPAPTVEMIHRWILFCQGEYLRQAWDQRILKEVVAASKYIHTSLLSMPLKTSASFSSFYFINTASASSKAASRIQPMLSWKPKKPPIRINPGKSSFQASSGINLNTCSRNPQLQQYQENSPEHIYLLMASHVRQPLATLSAALEMTLSRRDWHRCCKGLRILSFLGTTFLSMAFGEYRLPGRVTCVVFYEQYRIQYSCLPHSSYSPKTQTVSSLCSDYHFTTVSDLVACDDRTKKQ